MYSFVYVDIFGLDLQLQSDFVNHLYKRKFIEKEIYFFFCPIPFCSLFKLFFDLFELEDLFF